MLAFSVPRNCTITEIAGYFVTATGTTGVTGDAVGSYVIIGIYISAVPNDSFTFSGAFVPLSPIESNAVGVPTFGTATVNVAVTANSRILLVAYQAAIMGVSLVGFLSAGMNIL